MAGVTSNKSLTSDDNKSEVTVPQNVILGLLVRLISAERACVDMQKKMDQTVSLGQERNVEKLNINAVGSSQNPRRDCRQIMNPTANTPTWGLPVDEEQNFDIKSQGLNPGPDGGRSSKEAEKQMNADSLLAINFADSGIGGRSGIFADCSRRQGGRKIPQSKNYVPSNIEITGANQTFENMDGSPESSHMKLKNQLPTSFESEPEIELDRAPATIELDGAPATTLGASNFLGTEQSSPAHSHRLYRAISSKEDYRKSRRAMKKTGSHDSYFPHKGNNDKSSGVQRRPTKMSHTPVAAGFGTNGHGKRDNFMTAYLPHIISQTTMNGVVCELKRIKKENFCLMEKEIEMITKIQQLEGDLKCLKAEMDEMEKAHEEQNKKVDEERSFERANLLESNQKELDGLRKRNISLESMLSDERERFNRDENEMKKELDSLKSRNSQLESILKEERQRFNRDQEHWKKEIDKLKKADWK